MYCLHTGEKGRPSSLTKFRIRLCINVKMTPVPPLHDAVPTSSLPFMNQHTFTQQNQCHTLYRLLCRVLCCKTLGHVGVAIRSTWIQGTLRVGRKTTKTFERLLGFASFTLYWSEPCLSHQRRKLPGFLTGRLSQTSLRCQLCQRRVPQFVDLHTRTRSPAQQELTCVCPWERPECLCSSDTERTTKGGKL